MKIVAAFCLFFSTQFLPIGNQELNEALTRISEEFFIIDEPTIKQHYSEGDPAESGGDGSIFFVYDKNDRPIAVIKKYALDDPRYEHEYTTLIELYAMSLCEFHPVRLFGISEEIIDGERVGFIVESVAPGKSLNQYLREISQTSAKKRSELLLQMERGLTKTATALAELHKKGYIHGDTHLGNIFYDNKKDAVYFIDFATFKKNGPLGDDVAHVLFTTEILGAYYHLSDEENEQLQTVFLETYRKFGPEISDETIVHFRHNFIESYIKQFKDGDSDQSQFFYNYCKEVISL